MTDYPAAAVEPEMNDQLQKDIALLTDESIDWLAVKRVVEQARWQAEWIREARPILSRVFGCGVSGNCKKQIAALLAKRWEPKSQEGTD